LPKVIEIAEVSKRFGATQSLDQLTLSVGEGEVFGLLGPNGAGKTTTLRTLLGLVRPDSGHVSVLGMSPAARAREIRHNIGVLLETDGLYERLSAWHNLEFHGRIWHLPRQPRRQRMETLLRSFDLWDRRRDQVATWSKGMRQKLAVARALLHEPRLLLLDEPFSGLDPVAAVELRDRIIGLAREKNVTVVLATHDLAHVEKACTHVAVIESGRVIAKGTPDSIGGNDDSALVEIVAADLSDRVFAELKDRHIIVSYELSGGSARVRCQRSKCAMVNAELIKTGVAVEEFRKVRSSLEQTFLTLFRGQRD
jgi:ABC-2 type transport system ATP-binding protein